MRKLKRARRVYELARIEALIAANRQRLEELEAMDVCRWCNDIESPAEREACAP